MQKDTTEDIWEPNQGKNLQMADKIKGELT
jgi:hypothetical protein